VYKMDAFKFSLIDKLVGQQYVGKQTFNAALSQFYRLPAYNNMDLKTSYTIGRFDLGLAVSNVLNQRNLLTLTVNDSSSVGASPFDYSHRGTSLDQYFFAPSRGFEVSVTAHL
jgi:TonB dependent receptor